MNQALQENPVPHQEKMQSEIGKPYEARTLFRRFLKPLIAEQEDLDLLNQFIRNTQRFLYRVEQSSQNDRLLLNLLMNFQSERNTQKKLGRQSTPAQTTGQNQEEIDRGLKASRALSSQFFSEISDYLWREHGYYFNLLEKYEFASGENKESLLKTIIEATAGYVAKKQGLPTVTIDQRNQAVNAITAQLLQSSAGFTSLKKEPFNLAEKGKTNCQRLVEKRKREVKARLAVYLTRDDLAKLCAKEWIRKTFHEAVRGKRVYDTPFYQSLIEQAILLGDKDNGIGGKIYYGPPGTGKTELAIEINKREGYKSRVVSVHYWTSFSQLFGEAVIQVGIDANAPQRDKFQKALEYFTSLNEKGDKGGVLFWQMAERMAQRQQTTVVDFFRPLKNGEGETIIQPDATDQQVTNEQKTALLNAYLEELGAKYLALLEGKFTPEDTGDSASWVKGEILLALDKKERVILDEVDKASEHSLDSLSRLLAMSPGGEIQIREINLAVPSWFRIDATANVMSLGGKKEYFYDRFNHLFVGYPPAKDELMLASVWLTDEGGNINLSEYRQHQIVAFFTFLLPRLRKLYDEKRLSQPVSLRTVKEFCQYLVDPRTRHDKGASFEHMIEQLFLQQRMFAKDEKEEYHLRTVIDDFRRLFRKPVPAEPFSAQHDEGQTQTASLRHFRIQAVKQSLGKTVLSPLLHAITHLPSRGSSRLKKNGASSRDFHFYPVGLTREDLEMLPAEEERAMDLRYVPVKRFDQKTTNLALTALLPGEAEEIVLLEFPLPEDMGRLEEDDIQTTPDANILLVTYSQTDDGKKEKAKVFLLNGDGKQPVSIRSDQQKTRPQLLPDGNALVEFDSYSGKLKITSLNAEQENKPGLFDFSVKRYDVNVDGTLLLAETTEGNTFVFSLDRWRTKMPERITYSDAIINFTDYPLEFAGNNLLVQKQKGKAMLIE